jgi:hypothetical protein
VRRVSFGRAGAEDIIACRDARASMPEESWDVVEPSTLRFEHVAAITPRVSALRDLRPLPGGDRDRWIGVTADRELVEIDLDHGETRRLATLPESLFQLVEYTGLEPTAPRDPPRLTLHVSRDGKLAAVVQEDHGLEGIVVDLETGEHLMPLLRDHYCCEHSTHSFAFVEHAGRTLIVHASDWNRLDVHDPRTRELLTRADPRHIRATGAPRTTSTTPLRARGVPGSAPHRRQRLGLATRWHDPRVARRHLAERNV